MVAATILPQDCVIGVVTWDAEREVQDELLKVQIPDGCPPGATTFSSPDLGARFPAELPSRDKSHHELYMSVLLVSCQPPTRLLRPLPVPQHPWIHISLDISLTGFLLSDGEIVVITIMDQFFKMAHFRSCPQPMRQRRQACLMFFGSMVSCGTKCPTDKRCGSESGSEYHWRASHRSRRTI